MASLPAPETDWYVATTTRVIFARSWSGLRATTSWAVEQFGLAMMPFFRNPAIASAFTSGTISGTSGSMRQHDELSMTTAPCAPIRGDHSFDTAEPADIRQISTSEKS